MDAYQQDGSCAASNLQQDPQDAATELSRLQQTENQRSELSYSISGLTKLDNFY